MDKKTDSTKQHNLTQYIHEIRQVLYADFICLSEEKRKTLSAQYDSGQTGSIDFEKLSIPQLWSLEIAILSNLEKPELLRRTWIIRQKFRAQMGEEIYRHYLASLPASINDEALVQTGEKDAGVLTDNVYEILKCDAVNIGRQLQRLGYSKTLRNDSINQKKIHAIWAMAGLLAVAIIAFFTLSEGAYKFLLLVTYSGMIGAMLSLLQRLQNASNTPATFTDSVLDADDVAQNMSISYLLSLIVSGGVFAIIVYVLAASGLFNIADVLPKLEADAAHPFPMPTGNGYARLLIVCFLSGFAERLLPDKLDSLIQKAKSS